MYRLTLLLLTFYFFFSQLHFLLQPTLLFLTFALVILFLLLELISDEVLTEKFVLLLRGIRAEVVLVCYCLAEARVDVIQDDVDEIIVHYLGMDIKSINIIPGLLNGTYLFKITKLIKSPVELIVVVIVFRNSFLNHFPGSIPM